MAARRELGSTMTIGVSLVGLVLFAARCAHGVDPERPSAGGASGTSGPGSSASGTGGQGGGASSSSGFGGSTSAGPASSSASSSSAGSSSSSASSSSASSSASASSSSTSSSSASSSSASSGTGGGPTQCLQNIPANCPNCQTMNASDKPKCQQYLQCYIDNDCDPTTACGTNDAVCGVNTIGGGNAPQSSAIQTFMCACP